MRFDDVAKHCAFLPTYCCAILSGTAAWSESA